MRSAAITRASLVALAFFAVACSGDRPPTAPSATASISAERHRDDIDPAMVKLVRQLAAGRGVVPLERPYRVRPALVRLGQALIFDPILSGNRNISCTTCHLPQLATGDGRALSIGEGGSKFGPDRTHPLGAFIPRNAPSLFNLAAMRHLFWDGRVQLDANGRLQTPAGAQLTPAMKRVLEFGPASALAMFPVTNRFEMRGQQSSGNELAAIPDDSLQAIWRGLMRRLGAIREYREMFEQAYPGERFDRMTFAHASNAIGAFMVEKLSFNETPWDRFLRGDDRALSAKQLAGAQTFMTLKCSLCHNGATFSDDQFHDVAIAQIGPGEGDGTSLLDDFGRMRVTGDPADRYRFRTTPLRNVELTAPYGHDGAIASLRTFVEHYSESDKKLADFDPSTLELALRGTLQPTTLDVLAQRDTLLRGVVLTSDLVDQLMDYMSALTDDRARDLTHLIPDRVPSGLPVRPKGHR